MLVLPPRSSVLVRRQWLPRVLMLWPSPHEPGLDKFTEERGVGFVYRMARRFRRIGEQVGWVHPGQAPRVPLLSRHFLRPGSYYRSGGDNGIISCSRQGHAVRRHHHLCLSLSSPRGSTASSPSARSACFFSIREMQLQRARALHAGGRSPGPSLQSSAPIGGKNAHGSAPGPHLQNPNSLPRASAGQQSKRVIIRYLNNQQLDYTKIYIY